MPGLARFLAEHPVGQEAQRSSGIMTRPSQKEIRENEGNCGGGVRGNETWHKTRNQVLTSIWPGLM